MILDIKLSCYRLYLEAFRTEQKLNALSAMKCAVNALSSNVQKLTNMK